MSYSFEDLKNYFLYDESTKKLNLEICNDESLDIWLKDVIFFLGDSLNPSRKDGSLQANRLDNSDRRLTPESTKKSLEKIVIFMLKTNTLNSFQYLERLILLLQNLNELDSAKLNNSEVYLATLEYLYFERISITEKSPTVVEISNYCSNLDEKRNIIHYYYEDAFSKYMNQKTSDSTYSWFL